MSIVTEVRRAVRAKQRAEEGAEQARQALAEVVRRAFAELPRGEAVPMLVRETGLSKERVYQIKVGRR